MKMKLSCIPLLALTLGALNVVASESPKYPTELFSQLIDVVDLSAYSEMFNEIGSLHQKRDRVSTIETVLNVVNSSDIIFDVLDQIAYDPQRIELVSNITGALVGNLNTSSLSSLLEEVPLNYSLIYDSVTDSGVVSSLLDGILLDEDYRPTLVKLVTRVLNGSKNIFLYVVKDIFKKSKRADVVKRSTIETLVGNTIGAILSSDLVSDIAEDTLVALNRTQFLTYTVKRFIADEGYQNMTAQIGIDLIRNGDLKLNSNALNVTSLVDKALSKPEYILKLVNTVLSGNLDTSSFGKYSDAIKDIIADTEDTGVFALLNEYVFSQSHTVSTPLIPTGNIVVPKTTNTKTATTTHLRSNSTSATLKTQSGGNGSNESAREVASILSLLGASSYVTSTATSTSTSTSTSTASTFDLSEFIAELSDTTTSSATTTENLSELALLLALFANSNNNKEVVSLSSEMKLSEAKSNSVSGSSTFTVTKLLVSTQMIVVGTILFL